MPAPSGAALGRAHEGRRCCYGSDADTGGQLRTVSGAATGRGRRMRSAIAQQYGAISVTDAARQEAQSESLRTLARKARMKIQPLILVSTSTLAAL
jgi:hypothetical protein